jgi:hypothetical protein
VTPDVPDDYTAIAAKAESLAMPPIAVVPAIIPRADMHATSSDINVYALRTC